MDCSLPGSSVYGISQARILGEFPSPRDLPNPGIEPMSPALAGRFFTTEPPGKPPHQGLVPCKPYQSGSCLQLQAQLHLEDPKALENWTVMRCGAPAQGPGLREVLTEQPHPSLTPSLCLWDLGCPLAQKRV